MSKRHVRVECGACTLRPYDQRDVEVLPAIAGDWEVARYMGEMFPHPYTAQHARDWVAARLRDDVTQNFAIEVGGVLAGGAGYLPHTLERRRGAHIGYWLGKAYWGRGIATAALRGLVDHIFATTDLMRLDTQVFEPNADSMHVLEKCGFQREGIMRRAAERLGTTYDLVMYAKLRE